MANLRNIIIAELDPSKPLQEIASVIGSIMAHNRPHEVEILQGLRDNIDKRLTLLKGDDKRDEPVLQPDSKQADQG